MLSGKSDNEKITETEKHIQDLQKEKETLKFIGQVITQNLMKKHLPEIKMEKSKNFSEIVKRFSESFLLYRFRQRALDTRRCEAKCISGYVEYLFELVA